MQTSSINSPKYPIYIISKGRSDNPLTANALRRMGVHFALVVEPQEAADYKAAISDTTIHELPFSNLGQGSIPARNWVMDHAQKCGYKRHWIMDDNIRAFYRLNNNLKVPATTGKIFAAMEGFTDRFANVAMSGPNYFMFASRKTKMPPFTANTRVYSCILLENNPARQWRGKYNEDTDLSLRILKSGLCTILFNAFLAEKSVTMTMKGGNTDELYKQTPDFDGRLEMAKSLQQQHPDVVKITRKWGRWQHHVDYRPFKTNRLIRRTDIDWENMPKVDNFGMELVKA
jgi:hypothetical protein